MKAFYDEGLNNELYMFGYNLGKKYGIAISQNRNLMDVGKLFGREEYLKRLGKLTNNDTLEMSDNIKQIMDNDFDSAVIVISLGIHNGTINV